MGNMYERIIEVLEENGPIPISTIYEKMVSSAKNSAVTDKEIQLSSVKSVISRKKDLFSVHNNIVSINPEKEISQITLDVKRGNRSYRLKIDFLFEIYHLQSWSFFSDNQGFTPKKILFPYFSYTDMKKDLYKLKIWDWDSDEGVYGRESLYTIQLKTTKSSYVHSYTEMKAKEWKKITKVISQYLDIDALFID